ncbi:MAG: DUF4115 domain-containing protein [Cellvibrionaceae bacterium]|nr:DUF4115 domain-containing protein [Cellvibrionaceae bacterium]
MGVNDDDSSAVKAVSPGDVLAAQRRQLGWSLRQVADELKVSPNKVSALENNAFDSFPSPTYTRGHLRNYARLLDLSEQAIIDGHDAYLQSQQMPDVDGAITSAPTLRKSWWWVYVVLVALVLLWWLSYRFFGEWSVTDAPQIAKATADVETAQVPVASTSPVPVQVQQAVSDPLPDLSRREQVGDDLSLTPDDSAEQPAAESEQPLLASQLTASELIKATSPPPAAPEVAVAAEAPAPLDRLRFRFDHECWIEVVDHTQTVIFSGLQAAASQLELVGEAPFRVVIGHPEGTSLQLNGEAVVLQPKAGGKVLRLQVGE